ncbi:HAMP domain-containing sensor histidine kinase [Paenibacillus sediminis]|uniref:histidine kinase n=1 Tax=Paenibacillus sediminis TaxID=664909 RepID=A0ABS4H4L3_9BACL|nr:HAMP domain-containing sensor histidine kinase [Paenibacillus sediminis]MBP1937470.1 signal transduction histidine kinase [Paenibacillus sediminis]
MFRSTRKRLTIRFTFVMIGALFAFNLLSYSVLNIVLRHDQENVLKTNLMNKYHDLREHLTAPDDDDNQIWWINDKNGKMIQLSKYAAMYFNTNTIHQIGALKPSQIVFKELHIQGRESYWLFLSSPSNLEGKQLVGALNITEAQQLLHLWAFVSFGMSILFVAVCSVLAYKMADTAMQPIKEAMNKQKRFTADASHELRSPLAVMQTAIDVLQAEGSERMQPYEKQVLYNLQDEVQRMTYIVNQMLQLARADQGDILQKNETDLSELVKEIVQKFSLLARNHQLHLEAIVPNKAIVANVDSAKITQLLTILLDNAIAYTQPHGKIKLIAEQTSNEAILRCVDNGPGIDEIHHQKIFERFYRVESPRTRNRASALSSEDSKHSGTGLGLSIASEIVRMHGGDIRVDSMLGRGTEFVVTLPLN